MTESTTTPTTMTIGIDLGDRKSHICVLDAVGEIAEESRIATTPKALRARFEGLGGRLEERQQTLLFVILTERDTPLVPIVSQ